MADLVARQQAVIGARHATGVSKREVRRRWPGRTAALAAGALPALAFPETSAWWLAWFGLVPVLLLVRAAPTMGEGAVRAWFGGAGYMLALHHWLLAKTGVFTPLLALVLGATWVPWGALAHRLLGRGRLAAAMVLLPSAWVAAEVVRSWDWLGAPWGLLGATQWNFRPTLGPVAVGGVWALSFVVMAANVALAVALLTGARPPRRRVAALLAAGAAVVAAPASWALVPDAGATELVRIAGIQPGVVQGPELRFRAGEAATQALAGEDLDLVVWGESSVGFDLASRPRHAARLAAAARRAGADLLANVDARRGGAGGIYKSSVLVGPGGSKGRYDKMRLVPFGEYVPLESVLGWVRGMTEAAPENRRRGTGLAVLESDGLRLGPLVCFESAFPDLTRHLARRGADLVVVQSATTTFQESWAPEQHAALAALRAVESGRPVVHATLTGVSAAFDSRARRLTWRGTGFRGSYVVDVPIIQGARAETLYVRFGDWVPVLSVALLVLALLRAIGGRRWQGPLPASRKAWPASGTNSQS
jgi:apolipoprotein N-acyltransferase